MTNEGLTEAEVNELATLLPPGAVTTSFLRRAGFPPGRIPAAVAGQTPQEYWDLINFAIIDGAHPGGVAAIRTAVLRRWPENRIFDPAGPARRVLLLGAGPYTASQGSPAAGLRINEEYEAICAAAPSLDVQYVPAATAHDIRLILNKAPDILHLACHGRRGGILLFPAGADAEPGMPTVRTVHAGDLAAAILAYQNEHGARGGSGRLHGIVLNACYSADAAHELRACAHVVVAHKDDLPDAKAPLVAGAIYERLAATRSLARAARIVAAELPILDDAGRPLRDGIVIIDADERAAWPA